MLAPYNRYPIEELAAEGDFIDSAFLLLHGELPSKQVRAWVGGWVLGSFLCRCALLCPMPPCVNRCAGILFQLQEKSLFERELKYHTLVHEQLIQFYRGFRHDAHPMAIMCSVVGALSAFYPEVAEVK